MSKVIEDGTYWGGYNTGYLDGYAAAKKEMSEYVEKMKWDNRNSIEKSYTMTD